MIAEFDQVALVIDLPDRHFIAGDVGTVVDITSNGHQYTLEFFNFAGDTIAVVPVRSDQIRPLGLQEVPHTRFVDLTPA
ncbi:MAG: DUF4926 domain-containing protein [Caldilineaceae bacterium]